MKTTFYTLVLLLTCLTFSSCPSEDDEDPMPMQQNDLRNVYARLGTQSIASNNAVSGDGDLILGFNFPVADRGNDQFVISREGEELEDSEVWNAGGTEVRITPADSWIQGRNYQLATRGSLESDQANPLPSLSLPFSIAREPLRLLSLKSASADLSTDPAQLRTKVSVSEPIELVFSHPLAGNNLNFELSGPGNTGITLEPMGENTMRINFSEELRDFTVYTLALTQVPSSGDEQVFTDQELRFRTGAGSEPDFPLMEDEALLTLVQEQTFKYFWDFAEPNSGMARERNTSGNLVTSGGSGFGLMAMIVGVERGFITRAEAITRWKTITNFLEGADRFHGVWSHWINGETGAVIPFSALDNGGDLVETAFLVQGLLTVREYLKANAPEEVALINKIDELWRGVEWDWYTKGENEALFWHWSPDQEFAINLRITGHNETQIIYTLAAASPTHPIAPDLYRTGYARSGAMVNGKTFFGIEQPLGSDRGGPLFFSHYSYLGMNPKNLSDSYANYWSQNVAHSRINHAYCVANPKRFYGYSEESWGLTASDGQEGYSAHSPNNDRGVITPTAALSSIPYTPDESLAALRHFYYDLGDRLWGPYGFYDSFLPDENWTANSYLAIDQGPIVIMIENYRTGLLWDLYMAAPEVRAGLDALDFQY